MRQHLLQRFLARADLADLGLHAIDFAAQFGGKLAAVREVLLGAAALAGDRLQFHLALRHGFGELLARDVEPFDLGGGDRLFARGARGLAVDAGEVLFDLRQLILQRGGLAEQAENHLASGLDGALALADFELQCLRAAG